MELIQDTGVTYGSVTGDGDRDAAASADAPVRPAFGRYLPLLAGSGMPVLLLPDAVGAAATAGMLGVWLALVVRNRRRKAAGDQFGRWLKERIQAAEPLEAGAAAEIQAARGRPGLTRSDVEYFQKRTYLELLAAVVSSAGGAAAVDRVKQVEQAFDLPAAFTQRARLDAYRTAHVEAVGDHELTEEEEQGLVRLRAAFELSAEDLAEELALVGQLRAIRSVRAGRLPQVDVDTRLQRNEICHLASRGRLLKRRILRSFSRDGQKFKVRGFVIDKEGKLLITSKRLLLVHEGTTSILLQRILDVEVDDDRQVLTITRDGAARPVYVTTPDAIQAGAMVAALTEE